MRAAPAGGHRRILGMRAGVLAAGAFALPVMISLAAGSATAATAAARAGCAPGSGPHLAGKRITAAEIARYQGTTGLRCADLAGADLHGLNLVQLDLTKANLRHANLSHAQLGQATLTGANLKGADLRIGRPDPGDDDRRQPGGR